MKGRILRLLLLFSAFAWGISVLGIFLPWESVLVALNGLGAGPIPHDPMLEYWIRGGSAVFTGIGIFFLILALNMGRFIRIIPIVGGLMLLEGLVLLPYGLRLKLHAFPFFADVGFSVLLGAGILVFGLMAARRQKEE